MADLKTFAEQLVNLSVKEVSELADILKNEYGIEPAATAVAAPAAAGAGAAGDAGEEKSVAINEILDVLKSNQNIYLTDISGLNALETSNLRRMCFKAGVKLSVVKNTLLEKAMDGSEKDFGELKETLKGNTSVMIAEVSSAPAKVIKNFRKKSERPILKGAMIEEDLYIGDDQLETLFAIKSKAELIGDIVMLLQSPAKNLVSALSSSGGKLSGILQTLSNK